MIRLKLLSFLSLVRGLTSSNPKSQGVLCLDCSAGAAETGDFRPNIFLADQGDFPPPGDTDLAVRFLSSRDGDVFRRDSLGTVGGARGARNLSSGFIVLYPEVTAPIEALLSRKGLTSTGTQRRFTGCPGRYGQAVVDGRLASWISVPSSSSYWEAISLYSREVDFF